MIFNLELRVYVHPDFCSPLFFLFFLKKKREKREVCFFLLLVLLVREKNLGAKFLVGKKKEKKEY